ncbi:DoxX family protein (fragment) [Candidatus Sulfopaludibacter sp. SbA3]
MLVLACCAGMWSKPSGSLRSAMVIAGVVAVFAFVSYGAEAARQTGTKAPETIAVNGQPYALAHGKVLLFFFNPLCTHCLDSAKRMSAYQWGSTRIVVIPVEQAIYADAFLKEAGLKALVTSDFDKLKQVFGYTAYPFAVAVENGREKAAITRFENDEPRTTLKQLGFIQ